MAEAEQTSGIFRVQTRSTDEIVAGAQRIASTAGDELVAAYEGVERAVELSASSAEPVPLRRAACELEVRTHQALRAAAALHEAAGVMRAVAQVAEMAAPEAPTPGSCRRSDHRRASAAQR